MIPTPSLRSKQESLLQRNRAEREARAATAAANRKAREQKRLDRLRANTAEHRASRRRAKLVEAVYVLFNFQTEHVEKRRRMSAGEAQRLNFGGWKRRNNCRWVLETEVPVSDEDPRLVEAALKLIERTFQPEPRSLAPSSLGSAGFKQHALYFTYLRDKPFSAMEEVPIGK